jgi:hypothetical protein
VSESTYRQTVSFIGAVACLSTDDERADGWTRQSLPPFMPHTTDDPQVALTAAFTPVAAAPLVRTGRHCDLFLGRRGVTWRSGDLTHVIDVDTGDRYEMTANTVSVWYRTADAWSLRDPARIVREILVDRACRAGAVRLHAAAAAVDGRALVIIGAAGAGKSTTVAQLLAQGAAFMANDRVVVSPLAGTDELHAHGVPLAVRWSDAQLALFPDGPRYLAQYDSCSVLRRSDQRAGYRKVELTPREVTELAGSAPVAHAPVAAVVIADRHSDYRGDARVSRIASAEGMPVLKSCRLTRDPSFPAFFSAGPGLAGTDETRAVKVEHSLADVPWYRLSAAYTDADCAARLLDLVAADRTTTSKGAKHG